MSLKLTPKSKYLRVWVRRFWGILITALIFTAVCVQLTREMFPLLNDYREEVMEWLSDELGVEVSLADFSASFDGLRPKIYLQDLHMATEGGETILKAGKASAELNILSSLLQLRLAWGKLELHDFEAAFEQTENGRWQAKGLVSTAESTSDMTIDDPFDLFLFGRRVNLINTKLQFFFRVGHTTTASIPKITLENDANFHRLSANLGFDGNTDAFELVIEAVGDPRDTKNFDASGYLALNQFPLHRAIAAWGKDNGQWQEDHTLDLSLWFTGTSFKGVNFSGEIRSDGSPLDLPNNIALPTAAQGQFSGHWHRREGWQIQLLDMLMSWKDFKAPPFNLALAGGVDQPIKIAIDQLFVDDWLKVAYQLDLVKGKAAQALQTLNPQGLLTNANFEYRPQTPELFKLSANLTDVSVSAYQGAPALTNVNGYLETTAWKGSIILDSNNGFSMYYPKIYPKPMVYNKASGQVTWQIETEKNIVHVDSGLLQLEGEDGSGRGYLKLTLPIKQGAVEPSMILLIGLQNSDSRYAHKYIPTVIPDSLYTWLMDSIGEGGLSNSAFIYHGSIAVEPTLPRSIQLAGFLEDGHLKFDQHWPKLTDIDGKLLLDDEDLWIDIDRANLLGNQIDAATVTLVDNPQDEGRAIRVAAGVQGLAKNGIELLRQTPIRDSVGSALDHWSVTGNFIGEVLVLIPIRTGVAGSSQEVNIMLSEVGISMDNLNLNFKGVDGEIQYTTPQGLIAESIVGELWGERVNANIKTSETYDGGKQTFITYNGIAKIKDLYRWTQRPELLFAKGETQVNGRLSIPWSTAEKSRKIGLEVETDLVGVAIDLPKPYTKLAEDSKSLLLKSIFTEGYLYEFFYDNNTQVVIEGDYDQQEPSIYISLQSSKPSAEWKLEAGTIHIEGRLSEFELSSWQQANERYREFRQNIRKSDNNLKSDTEDLSMISRFNLIIDRFRVRDFQLDDLDVTGEIVEQSTRLSLSNELLQGDMILFDSEQPAELRFDYIRLPKIDINGEANKPSNKKKEINKKQRQSYLVSLDLAKIQAFDFATDELTIGDENLGSMAFDVRPEDKRIVLSGINVNVAGLSFSGMNEGEGADLIWHKDADGGYSELNGRITAGDLANTLAYWDQPKILENESANFDVVLNWAGAPDQVSLAGLEGRVGVNVEQGRFIRGADAGNNPLLRLIALFNFDTLARRLRLDFSDLYKGGLSFDRVYGDLYFDNGKVLLREPIIVQSPTSNLQLGGEIDIENENLNGSLVATLPVTGNLAVVAAFVGGLPAAIGVYLVGKLLKKQVDKVSSITYSTTGPWESPKIKVKKVFDNQGAKNAGLEIQKNSSVEQDLQNLIDENLKQSQGNGIIHGDN